MGFDVFVSTDDMAFGTGGGYIVSSGNSLAGYLEPDNVMALAATVRACGAYPIDL